MKLMQIAERLLVRLNELALERPRANWTLDDIASELGTDIGRTDMAARFLAEQRLVRYSGGSPAGIARIEPLGVVAVENGAFDGDDTPQAVELSRMLKDRLDPIEEQLWRIEGSIDQVVELISKDLPDALDDTSRDILADVNRQLAEISANAKTASEAATGVAAVFAAEKTRTFLQKIGENAGPKIAQSVLAKLVFAVFHSVLQLAG